MKIKILLTFYGLIFSLYTRAENAPVSENTVPQFISESEEKQVLNALNQICGDTWCGGDLNFSLNNLSCDNQNGCELELNAQGYTYNGIEFPKETFRCQLTGLTERRDVLRFRSNGLTYTETLYDAVTDCIREEVEAVLLPLSLPAVPLSETSCLELIESRPRIAEGYADLFFKEDDLQSFAVKFYEGFLNKLSAKTSCLLPEFPTPEFTCIEFDLAAPICGAETKDYRIGLVKDFVDSARFVVSNRKPQKSAKIPGISSEYNWQTLYLPNPAFCYDGLLDQEIDSQVFPIDVSQWLPAKDKRFVMAETLRYLVKQKAIGYYQDSCQKEIFEYPVGDVSCKYLGETGLDACVITPEDGGYYVFIWSEGDPKLNFIFNRYD